MQIINKAIASVATACSKKFNPKEFKMPKQFWLLTVMLTGLMLTNFSVQAESTPPAPVNSELENTERNVRDSANTTLTPEDQKENRADRKITAAIRRAVVKKKSLSLDAHNIKIITRDGLVTLRGPVENDAEKTKLQAIAEKVKGVKQVDNQLESKTP
jgi:osmotically-inducible protein OsmY